MTDYYAAASARSPRPQPEIQMSYVSLAAGFDGRRIQLE